MTGCACRCHAYGAGTHVTCDQGPPIPGGRSCTTLHAASSDTPRPEPIQFVSLVKEKCPHCGGLPGQHLPVEGDCILPHRYNDKHHPPRARIGWLCTGCVQRHRDWLNQILDMWALLPSVVPLGSVPDDTAEHARAKKQPATPALVRLQAWALLYGRNRTSVHQFDGEGRAIYDEGRPVMVPGRLGAFLPDVPRILCQWALDAGRPQPRTVSGAIVALQGEAETIAHQPWVDEYDAELAWILRAMRDAHGIDQSLPIGRCISVKNGRECGGHVREQPGGNPKCDRCRRRYGLHDLVRLQLVEGKEAPVRLRRRLSSASEGTGRA